MTRRKQQAPKKVKFEESSDEPLDLSLKSNSALDLTTKKKANDSSVSSLKSLEQKFGGNAFLAPENNKPKPIKSSALNSTLNSFGGQVYHAALYGSCLPSTVPLRQPTPRPSKFFALANKFTSYTCQCGAAFDCLYDLTVHMQKTKHKPTHGNNQGTEDLPKLVRGQDMWLSQGSEQTRQILRCITCCESFSSLAELTVHMMHTKHYSNILHEVKSASGKKEGTLHCEVCGQDVECSKFGTHAQQCVKRDNSKSPQQENEIERKPSPLPLVEPADEDAPSALKAMQSFIERSFSSTPKNSLPSSRSSSTSPKRKYLEDEEVRPKDDEHPLNSLQRLIKNTETTSSSTPNIILVNPIVTVVSPSEKTPPIEKENSEFTCPVCKRAYVSKGSYRYHVSRCHVRPGKRKMDGKSEIGEKLTNYYKLAAELSSK